MNKKFELLREAVGCYKANHVSGDINEKALLEFIDELEQLTIPDVVNCSNCNSTKIAKEPVYRCVDCNCFHDKNGQQL